MEWITIRTTGYMHSVAKVENRAAHGGVCHTQVAIGPTGIKWTRKVLSNGRHTEIGKKVRVSA